MEFSEQYNLIKSIIKCDFTPLENEITELFSNENPLDKELLKFLTAPSKRLRPLFAFLFLRANNIEITTQIRKILLAVELIHNASLIHDDIIDEAEERRGEETISSEFSNSLAVVAGDYLLSVALKKVLEANSVDVIKHFALAMTST